MNRDLVLRRERPGDQASTRSLHDLAFGVPDGAQHSLETQILDRLRADGHVVRILTRGPGSPADNVQAGEAQPASALADGLRVDGATQDADQSDRAFPDLTHLARRALEMLVSRIDGDTSPSQEVAVPWTLVARESTTGRVAQA